MPTVFHTYFIQNTSMLSKHCYLTVRDTVDSTWDFSTFLYPHPHLLPKNGFSDSVPLDLQYHSFSRCFSLAVGNYFRIIIRMDPRKNKATIEPVVQLSRSFFGPTLRLFLFAFFTSFVALSQNKYIYSESHSIASFEQAEKKRKVALFFARNPKFCLFFTFFFCFLFSPVHSMYSVQA